MAARSINSGPEPVDGQSTFALRFNRYRRECGHLFQRRYKSLLVDPADGLGALCHFLHLNPVRAGVTTVDRLAGWAWRSFRWLMTPGKRAAWYRPEACLEHAGGRADTAAGRRKDAEYLAWLAAHAPEQKRLRFDRMSKGWAVGTKEFKAALVDDHREAAAALERGEPDLAETRTARLEKRLDELLAAMGKKRGNLDVERKSAPWRVALAAEMKAGTTATNQWLADALAMGSPFQVSRLASACRAEPGAASPFLRAMRSGRRRRA